jgi:hypothetical protein
MCEENHSLDAQRHAQSCLMSSLILAHVHCQLLSVILCTVMDLNKNEVMKQIDNQNKCVCSEMHLPTGIRGKQEQL